MTTETLARANDINKEIKELIESEALAKSMDWYKKTSGWIPADALEDAKIAMIQAINRQLAHMKDELEKL